MTKTNIFTHILLCSLIICSWLVPWVLVSRTLYTANESWGSGHFKPPNHEFSDLLQTGKYNYTLWLNCLKTTTKCKCSSFLPHHFQKKKEHTHCSLWLARYSVLLCLLLASNLVIGFDLLCILCFMFTLLQNITSPIINNGNCHCFKLCLNKFQCQLWRCIFCIRA